MTWKVPVAAASALCPSRTIARRGRRNRPAAVVEFARHAVLTWRVRLLVAATISYNVVEAVVAVAVGTVAGSTALIGFGLDSVIEVS